MCIRDRGIIINKAKSEVPATKINIVDITKSKALKKEFMDMIGTDVIPYKDIEEYRKRSSCGLTTYLLDADSSLFVTPPEEKKGEVVEELKEITREVLQKYVRWRERMVKGRGEIRKSLDSVDVPAIRILKMKSLDANKRNAIHLVNPDEIRREISSLRKINV
eukprot:TRINITY_DN12979_c0_g1_i3.p1 TRINITY_DN12979_c0_g1~~TRINITY_DN12979_c0_g1_i3.p1  ORF type:complete len:163 (+),score=34.47 TRINITY_DN12979_c0_g1_i3:73-561(+)